MSRLAYYLRSIFTLFFGLRNWPEVLFTVLIGRTFTVRLQDNTQFRARTLMDLWIIKETCLDHIYERIGTSLAPDWTIVDIGAGLGDFTVRAAQQCIQGHVYAFEPFPQSFALLEHNIRINQLSNINLYPNAVAGQSISVTLIATGAAVQHRTVGLVNGPSITVQALSLEAILALLPHRRCHLLKLDCEGAEYDILMQTPRSALQEVQHICLEYHDEVSGHNHLALAEYLRSMGFDVRLTPNPVHSNIGFLYALNHDTRNFSQNLRFYNS